MRPRFTLKWLLIITTVASFILCLLVKPTLLANQFATEILKHDLSRLKALSIGGVTVGDTLRSLPDFSQGTVDVRATVRPGEELGTPRMVVITVAAPDRRGTSVPRFTYLVQSNWNGLKLLDGIPYEYLKNRQP